MTQYYDQHEDRDFSEQEIIAICNRELKPYPESWFEEAEEIIAVPLLHNLKPQAG